MSPGLGAYCNSLLYGVTDRLMRQVGLQSVQNAAARLIRGAHRREHITPVVRQLHWSPVRRRVEFKIASSAVKQSTWLSVRRYSSRRGLRSSARFLRSSSERKCSVTRVSCTVVLLQLDHVSGTTYLPVCETRKSAAQNSENN